MAKVLVVGGAGYIGGAASAWLLDHGHDVWCLDDLSTGHRELIQTPKFLEARAGDRARVLPLLEREKFDCVMHFAAFALVSESVAQPAKYFENNVEQTRALLEMMLAVGTRKFIFSSTCAVFGAHDVEFIHEELAKSPINPYGQTKLEVEKMLAELAASRGLESIALRYFNAAGAEKKLRTGECHEPESHLIPLVLRRALEGKPAQIFGTDYPTPDGTCVRDYIHVTDLSAAHGTAMERLLATPRGPGCFEAYNLGSENGYSVREVIAACEKAIGRPLAVEELPRRPGDPPRLVGDSKRARAILGFKPAHTLGDCIATALAWQKKWAAK